MVFRIFLFIYLFCLSLWATPGYFEPWGSDADLKYKAAAEKEKKVDSLAARIANAVILFHQEVISPADGPRSNFRPTSSRYMQLAIQRYGFVRGYVMGCDRLLRENDEKWVYQTVQVDDKEYKFDPAFLDKHVK